MKPTKTLTPIAAYPWQLEMFLRFSDTDAVGHVNNVAVFRYHDNAAMFFISEALAAAAPGRVAGPRGLLPRSADTLRRRFKHPEPLVCAVAGDFPERRLHRYFHRRRGLAQFRQPGDATAAALGDQLQAFMANQP